MCYCTVLALSYFEFEGNFRVQSIWGFSSFLKKTFVKYQTIEYPASSGFSRPDAALRKERNRYNSNIILTDKSVFLTLFEV